MKKLVLKKDVVARINNGEMNQLRGGYDGSGTCPDGTASFSKCPGCPVPSAVVTCPGKQTCSGAQSCDLSCTGTCQTCPWLYSCADGCTEYY